MPGVLLDSLKQWIVQPLNQKTIVVYKDLQIQASFATYNRWQRLVYDEPRTGQRRINGPLGTWTCVPYAYTERVERRNLSSPTGPFVLRGTRMSTRSI